MIYRAKMILPMIAEPIPDGAIRIEDGKIKAVGRADELTSLPGEEVIDLGASILMPGLINGHCHLDYTGFRGSIDQQNTFTDWIKRINALKRNFTPEDYLRDIAEGFQLLAEGGVTTVANVEAFPELLPLMDAPPLRTWWFLELIDIRTRIDQDNTLTTALRFFQEHAHWKGGFGLSPHAPYTASVDLYRLSKMCGEEYGMICTTHIAESVEEHEMFSHASGPLYEFIASLGREMSDCGQGSALSHLVEHGVIGSNCLIAHLNYLHDYDYELVVKTGASVVHCPKCHTYFDHGAFPLKRLQALGVNICLGTDSLASNNSLDLRSEMRHAQVQHDLTAREVLEMTTLCGARALGQAGKLGELSPGAQADVAVFSPSESVPVEEWILRPYDSVLDHATRLKLLLVEGEKIDIPPRNGHLWTNFKA